MAIAEIERMRKAGEKYLVFGQPALWWLDYYQDFTQHLRTHYPRILENERMVIFDLQDAVSQQ